MENIDKFINDFADGVKWDMLEKNYSKSYVDCELQEYLGLVDIEDLDEKLLDDVMNKIINLLNDEVFDCWKYSSNEIAVERKSYIEDFYKYYINL